MGVEFSFWSDNETITKFKSEIQTEKPSISYIENITFQELDSEEIEKLDV